MYKDKTEHAVTWFPITLLHSHLEGQFSSHNVPLPVPLIDIAAKIEYTMETPNKGAIQDKPFLLDLYRQVLFSVVRNIISN